MEYATASKRGTEGGSRTHAHDAHCYINKQDVSEKTASNEGGNSRFCRNTPPPLSRFNPSSIVGVLWRGGVHERFYRDERTLQDPGALAGSKARSKHSVIDLPGYSKTVIFGRWYV